MAIENGIIECFAGIPHLFLRGLVRVFGAVLLGEVLGCQSGYSRFNIQYRGFPDVIHSITRPHTVADRLTSCSFCGRVTLPCFPVSGEVAGLMGVGNAVPLLFVSVVE